ncbi:hypothetical protein BS47DRAFT_1339034 [Hydnum rufescens UP504]|uniref:Uncharacterized protein n=1 Tax=Hydnum rufescens UP504 TaxID=1448309 RepID=A0A9P6B5E0_9AGAM|nr:hypothetical protein BS47DRAFT_1339034 [Hydnum rufescens UP504]
MTVPLLDNSIGFGKDKLAKVFEYRSMVIGNSDGVSGCALGEPTLLNLCGHVGDVLTVTVAGIFCSPQHSAALPIAS